MAFFAHAGLRDLLRLSALTISLLLICVPPVEGQRSGDFLLSRGKAGPVKLGMAVDAVYERYDRSLIKIFDLSVEGFFAPALEIYLDSAREGKSPSLVLNIDKSEQDQWIVSGITVYDQRFKAESGVSVGSTLAAVRTVHKVQSIDQGELGIYAWIEELEMLLWLDVESLPEKWHLTKDASLIPDSARVRAVSVTER